MGGKDEIKGGGGGVKRWKRGNEGGGVDWKINTYISVVGRRSGVNRNVVREIVKERCGGWVEKVVKERCECWVEKRSLRRGVNVGWKRW